MKDSERWRFEAFERVKQFSLDNPADFASGCSAALPLDVRKSYAFPIDYK